MSSNNGSYWYNRGSKARSGSYGAAKSRRNGYTRTTGKKYTFYGEVR